MSDCCNQPKYYTYTEFVLISESMSTLKNNNFVIKLVYDEIDSKGEKVQFGKLVLTSLFESIGVDEYSVITDIVHHLSDKKTSKSTVNHSIAFLSEDDLKKYPADILAEFIFNSVVTSKLSVTNKNSVSLYNTFLGSHSAKMFSKNSKNFNKKGVSSNNNRLATTVGSSNVCGNIFKSQLRCSNNCFSGTCDRKIIFTRTNSTFITLYKCNCNNGG